MVNFKVTGRWKFATKNKANKDIRVTQINEKKKRKGDLLKILQQYNKNYYCEKYKISHYLNNFLLYSIRLLHSFLTKLTYLYRSISQLVHVSVCPRHFSAALYSSNSTIRQNYYNAKICNPTFVIPKKKKKMPKIWRCSVDDGFLKNRDFVRLETLAQFAAGNNPPLPPRVMPRCFYLRFVTVAERCARILLFCFFFFCTRRNGRVWFSDTAPPARYRRSQSTLSVGFISRNAAARSSPARSLLSVRPIFQIYQCRLVFMSALFVSW